MDGELKQFIDDRRYSLIDQKHPDYNRFPKYYTSHRFEILLRPGERVFIPSKWWHFVQSEDPDPDTGLNVAINFWYQSKDPRPARFGWHNLNVNEIIDIVKKQESLMVSRSPLGYFPPGQFAHKYNNKIKIESLTYDEFISTKNHELYITQNYIEELNKFSPWPENSNVRSQVWINFGNCFTIPHWDGEDNWLCQLQGNRRVIIAPNDETSNLYPMNPYPDRLLETIERQMTSCPYIHFNNDDISESVIREISEAIGTQSEVHIECDDLSAAFARHMSHFNIILEQNGVGFNVLRPTKRCSLFHIKKFKKGDKFLTPEPNLLVSIIWALTPVELNIKGKNHRIKPGGAILYPNSWLFPVVILEDCMTATPFKDEDSQ